LAPSVDGKYGYTSDEAVNAAGALILNIKKIAGSVSNTCLARGTYRSWLDATGAPTGVQQDLMHHAQVSTTMNVCGNALMKSKSKANSKVVRMALRPARRKAQDR
jgi:integrase